MTGTIDKPVEQAPPPQATRHRARIHPRKEREMTIRIRDVVSAAVLMCAGFSIIGAVSGRWAWVAVSVGYTLGLCCCLAARALLEEMLAGHEHDDADTHVDGLVENVEQDRPNPGPPA